MAVPFGLSTTLYITLTDGQAVTILYGWIFVSIVSLSIAASLAEICAVSPSFVPSRLPGCLNNTWPLVIISSADIWKQ